MPPSDARPLLCVSLHDVAPATWPQCQRLLAALDAVGPVAVTLLVVPEYHRRGRVSEDRPFLDAMETRLARGDEIALHGYYHLDDGPPMRSLIERLRRRGYTAGEGEFSALGEAQARARLESGLEMFGRLGWPVAGFVAPAWLASPGTWAALRCLPFTYTSTLSGLHGLHPRRFIPSRSLVYSVRAPWRRWMSRGWNRYLFTRLRNQTLLRFGLHPADACHPGVLREWLQFLQRALRNRLPVTEGGALRAMIAQGYNPANGVRFSRRSRT